MSPFRRRKDEDIPSWVRNLQRWQSVVEEDIEEPAFAGSEEFWSALQNKDPTALAQVLKEYPQIIEEEFESRAKTGKRLHHGRLAHMIVNLQWTDALDVLRSAGDRFDLPADKKRLRNQRSYSALEHAIFEGKMPALNRMLKLGVDPNGSKKEAPAMEILLCGSRQRDSDKEVGKALAAAGVDPWRKLPTKPYDAIVVALLAANRSLAVLPLLASATDLPSPDEGKKLMDAWLVSAQRNIGGGVILEEVFDILKELHRLGCEPPSLRDAVLLSKSVKDLFPERAVFHSKIMEFLRETGYYTVEDWSELSTSLGEVSYKGSGDWKSAFERDYLDVASGQAPSARHSRLRL